MSVLPNVIGPDCGLYFCSYCDFYFRLCCVPLSFNLSCSLLLPFDSSFGFHLYPTPTCLGLEGLVIVVYLLNMIYLLCIMANYAYHLVSIWFRIEIEWNGSIPDFENGMALSAVWFKTIIIMWRAWGARGNVSARVCCFLERNGSASMRNIPFWEWLRSISFRTKHDVSWNGAAPFQ
jgi:hypothetical protein